MLLRLDKSTGFVSLSRGAYPDGAIDAVIAILFSAGANVDYGLGLQLALMSAVIPQD
jgi:hypothetical protein